MTKKVLIVFGTRPEAIKLAPVIRELRLSGMDSKILVTAQHRSLLDQVLKIFNVKPDYDLDIMLENQNLNDVTELILNRFNPILLEEKPDFVLVQGDTTTAFASALGAFYAGVAVGHVEAGLRTYDKYSPFPEEINRQLISRIADIHFAPTESAQKNLLNENIPSDKIHVVGNTEIDSLLWILSRYKDPSIAEKLVRDLTEDYGLDLNSNKKIILVTAHRRESFNKGLEDICGALKEIAVKRDDVVIVYPVHPNPNVQKIAHAVLGATKNVFLTIPIEYELFAYLMSRAHFILTDSGGIQESAPSLNKPVLVMREKTERGEGVEIGVSKLVGTNKEKIVSTVLELLDNPKTYLSMTGKKNPYGDGTASLKIVEVISSYLKK